MTDSNSGPVRLLLIDDHPVVRSGLRYVLEQGDQVTVIGEGESAAEAVRLAAELQPDVIFMDICMPEVSGIEATRLIKAQHPNVKILIVSTHNDEEYVVGALEAGADGYLLKQCNPRELQAGVLQVHAGERVLHDTVIRTLIAKTVNRSVTPVRETLSDREREVLQLLADGATSKEIAVVLGLKPKTVENHRARILDKLGVANSAAAVRTAVAQGLVAQVSATTPRWDYRVA
jgi:DNA-binding NarL/FixJ family response regulator